MHHNSRHQEPESTRNGRGIMNPITMSSVKDEILSKLSNNNNNNNVKETIEETQQQTPTPRPIAITSTVKDFTTYFPSIARVRPSALPRTLSTTQVPTADQHQHQNPTSGSHSVETFFDEDSTSIATNEPTATDATRPPSEPNSVAIPSSILVTPDSVRKIVLTGHPLKSIEGISEFSRVSEVYVTECDVKEVKWSDFNALQQLHRLFMYNCGLQTIEPFQFNALKILWLSGNKLTSLSFLGEGLPTLQELNVAKNEITFLHEENFQQCFSLHTLNLAGNLLSTQSDIIALKVLPCLKNLYFADPMYGKCPISGICDCRPLIVNLLGNLASLDGKFITVNELVSTQNYVSSRALYYLTQCIKISSMQATKRQSSIKVTNKKLEKIGYRILQLTCLEAKFRRSLSSTDMLPLFSNAKSVMKEQVNKIQGRMTCLTDSAKMSMKRLQIVMQISRWEQDTEKWLSWIEYQTFGNVQSYLTLSVHSKTSGGDPGPFCGMIHQLLSSLSCSGLWPQESLVKVESVITLIDKGMECITARTYTQHFQPCNEPKYIPPEIDYQLEKPLPPTKSSYPYYRFPAYQSQRNIPTYTDPDYKPPPPLRPFPDSITGLPEQLQPLYMFLISPANENPLMFLQRIFMQDRTRRYEDLRLTNCLWLTNSCRTQQQAFSVVIVVKVLAECLQTVPFDRNGHMHAWDCSCFCLTQGNSFSVAYVVNISFNPVPKATLKLKLPENDDELIYTAESTLQTLTSGLTAPIKNLSNTFKRSSYLKNSGNGVIADLSTLHAFHSFEGIIDDNNNISTIAGFEPNTISKYIGSDASKFLTSLNLCGNKIGVTVGLRGLNSLKKLNLTHNNLTTLSGLERLPNLIEFKVGWNSLRFLQSNTVALGWATPRLLTLEILPNPFQDVHDVNHIPLTLNRALPLAHRIDLWTAPFAAMPKLIGVSPPGDPEAGFAGIVLKKSLGNESIYPYLISAGQALTELTNCLPTTPPFRDGTANSPVDLNLSDNYLTSNTIKTSAFVTSLEWRICIVKLQLQENLINSLDWMKDYTFPNLQFLNLSNNLLHDLEYFTSETCPNLAHLYLSCNPLKCDLNVLNSLKYFLCLKTLDCNGSPLSGHPDYSSFILTNMNKLEVLDGIAKSEWEFSNAIDQTGGILTNDWLDTKLKTHPCTNGQRKSANEFNKLSLANCCLQKIALTGNSLHKICALNMQHNSLPTLSSLSNLANLRVLFLSHNSVYSLGGSTCPQCYSNTAQSQAANKLRHVKVQEVKSQKPPAGCNLKLSKGPGPSPFPAPPPTSTPRKPGSSKFLFPKLETIVLSHNGLAGMADLHFHSMPFLETIMLSCNNLNSLKGLENVPTLKALVLDNNHIRDVPPSSFTGCKSLKYLHLEHNRLTSLPRFPHLNNLTGLYLGYNKIQNLTEVDCLTRRTEITECSLKGNLVSNRTDYRLNVAARLPYLTMLDGKDLATEKAKLQEISNKLVFPLLKPTSVKPQRNDNNSNSGLNNNPYNFTRTSTTAGQFTKPATAATIALNDLTSQIAKQQQQQQSLKTQSSSLNTSSQQRTSPAGLRKMTANNNANIVNSGFKSSKFY